MSEYTWDQKKPKRYQLIDVWSEFMGCWNNAVYYSNDQIYLVEHNIYVKIDWDYVKWKPLLGLPHWITIILGYAFKFYKGER